METYFVEVIDRFEEDVPARDLIYSPVSEDVSVRTTRVYEVTATGTRDELEAFVEDVLVDPVSQEYEVLENEAESALTGYDQRLDVWLKSTVLDLEEDYLLEYCDEHRDSTGFTVEDLRLLTRHYLDGAGDEAVDAIVRDIANPVIQDWSVTALESSR